MTRKLKAFLLSLLMSLSFFSSSANAQLENILQALSPDSAVVLHGRPIGSTPFYDTEFLTLVASIDSIMASLQKYGQSIDNYTSVATAYADAKARSGVLWVPRNSKLFQDSTITVPTPTENIAVIDARNGGLKVLGLDRVTNFDIIAWFPPADSGAVLDTLNARKEVLGFYHNTDSVYATNSWSVEETFREIDSLVVDVEAPNTSGDSVAFVIKWIGIAEGELGGAALANTMRDTIDLGTASRAVKRLVFSSTFSGISAGDELMLELSRDTTIAQNVAAVVNVRRVRIYWR